MIELVIILFCLFCNALIAATEVAFVSLSRSRLKQRVALGDEVAKRVLTLRENPERTLSLLQLGTTFVGVVAAAVGGSQTNELLTPFFEERWSMPYPLAVTLSILLFVVPYTYLSIVFSELVPKILALRNPQRVLYRASNWLIGFGKILKPLIFLLEKLTKLSLRWFFPKTEEKSAEHEEVFLVGKTVHPYMVNLANIEKRHVADILIAWEDTVKVSIEASTEEVKELVLSSGHTRIPVVEKEKPIGLLHAKEFMALLDKRQIDWKEGLLPILSVEKKASLVDALKYMQKEKTHMCLVMEEEKPIGMVTIEDILEEVVGELYDEDDYIRGPIAGLGR